MAYLDFGDQTPLAESMRPQTLEEYVGQPNVNGGVWGTLIEEDRIPSMVLWGPPGCGKTSLANVIARRSKVEKNNHVDKKSD